jgi:hypothetical protein
LHCQPAPACQAAKHLKCEHSTTLLQHSDTTLLLSLLFPSLPPGSTQSASWRRSGSHNASGSKLSSSDLAHLRIDDLADLVKKTGAQLPREPTKDNVISGLIQKGVSLNDLTRGKLNHQTQPKNGVPCPDMRLRCLVG